MVLENGLVSQHYNVSRENPDFHPTSYQETSSESATSIKRAIRIRVEELYFLFLKGTEV